MKSARVNSAEIFHDKLFCLPRIEDSLDSLNGSCIFTSIDLKVGYWQVELDPESIPLTAFTVGPLGFYECVRLAFGLFINEFSVVICEP